MAQQDYSDPYGRPTTGMGFGRGKEYLGPVREGRDRFSVIPPQPALGPRHPGRHHHKHSKFYDDLATARELLSVALTSDNSGEDMRFFNRFRDTVLPRYQPDDYQYDYSYRFRDNEIIQRAMKMFVGGYDNAPIRTFAQNDPASRLNLGGDVDSYDFDVRDWGLNNLIVDMGDASSVQPGKVVATIPDEMLQGLRLAERGRLPLSYEEQAYLNMLVDPNFAFQNAVNNITDIAPVDFLNQVFVDKDPLKSYAAMVFPYSTTPNLEYNLGALLRYDDRPVVAGGLIPVDEVVNHEFGHIVDFYPEDSYQVDEPKKSVYSSSIRSIGEQDAEYQKNLGLTPDGTWQWNNQSNITYGQPYITSYGTKNTKEEFAERFRLYAADKIEGWTAVDGSGNILRFEDLYPNTAHYIDNLLLARMKAYGEN